MELWIASSNRGKIDEFKSLLFEKSLTIHSQSELPVYTSPEETGDTFEANARIKAKSLASVKKDVWIIADDSGIEVEGLNNLPGVHSARYAGPKATDAENTAKLLKMLNMRSAGNRKAQFRVVMIAISPEGEEFKFEGICTGNISKKIQGTNGFGYDSVFIPDGEEKTFGELGPAVKNKVSHRAAAIRKFAEII